MSQAQQGIICLSKQKENLVLHVFSHMLHHTLLHFMLECVCILSVIFQPGMCRLAHRLKSQDTVSNPTIQKYLRGISPCIYLRLLHRPDIHVSS